jgi:hypothetical protein
MNDRISSFRVQSGVWVLCYHANFEGACTDEIKPGYGVDNLDGTVFQGSISSIKLVRCDRATDAEDGDPPNPLKDMPIEVPGTTALPRTDLCGK